MAYKYLPDYYEPLTNGDAASPELIYAAGDVIMVLIIVG